jgi:hypothetical protein
MDWNEMSNLDRGLSIDAFYQVSFNLDLRFRGEDFSKEIYQPETRIAYGDHVC